MDTEQIFNNLYRESQVIEQAVSEHFIWVTGLIHKVAYFITPNIQTLFDSSLLEPKYNGYPILAIYNLKICNDTTEDIDLRNYFHQVIKHIDYCPQINSCNTEELKSLWKKEFTKSINEQRKKERNSIFIINS